MIRLKVGKMTGRGAGGGAPAKISRFEPALEAILQRKPDVPHHYLNRLDEADRTSASLNAQELMCAAHSAFHATRAQCDNHSQSLVWMLDGAARI